MHIRHKHRCRVCGSASLKPVIDLQPQYLQGSFVREGATPPPLRKIPTVLVRCDVEASDDACGLLQLAHTVPPEVLYANYWYRSGTNQTMREHLGAIVADALRVARIHHRRVLDIGCNDGTLLANYPGDFERWGFDPSDIAQTVSPPINLVGTAFPSSEGRARLGDRRFDIITSIAMFYDLEDPVAFAASVRDVLGQNGIWIVEMSYLPLMLRTNSFDTICHEHLEYYSLDVLTSIAERAGLRIFRAELHPINGGSIRCYLCHQDCLAFDTRRNADDIRRLRLMEFEMRLDTDEPYRQFQKRIEYLRERMSTLLSEIRGSGKTVHLYGASTKGNVLLQWYGIDSSRIRYAADRNPQKHGARTLGTSIEIISEEDSRAMRPDYYLVLPWHFRREFLAREAETIRAGTKMIFPLPDIDVVDAGNLDEELRRAAIPARLNEILGLHCPS